jgi:hypothetical protein
VGISFSLIFMTPIFQSKLKKEVYERIGIRLDLSQKVVNLIVRHTPKVKKDRFKSPYELHIIKIMYLRK